MNKNFDDFLKTLTEEKINEIANNTDNIKVNFSITQEGFKDLFRSISILDIQLTLGILKLYHDWLNS